MRVLGATPGVPRSGLRFAGDGGTLAAAFLRSMRLATLLSLLLVLPACDAGGFWETAERVPLRIDVQTQFDDDRVRLEVGGVPVYDDRVTTEATLSLAEIVRTNVPPGATTLAVTVNGGPSAALELDPADGGVVAVSFDGADVSVLHLDEAPLYD